MSGRRLILIPQRPGSIESEGKASCKATFTHPICTKSAGEPFKRRPRSTRDGSFSFFATVFSCAIVCTVWLNLWNDLLDEAVYWITLALLLGSVARTRS